MRKREWSVHVSVLVDVYPLSPREDDTPSRKALREACQSKLRATGARFAEIAQEYLNEQVPYMKVADEAVD